MRRNCWAGATMLSSVGVVIHPSAERTIHANDLSVPRAPKRIGTRGCWTGFGQAQLGPKLTNSPWYDAVSWLHS